VQVGGHLAYLRLSFRMMLIIGKITVGNSENYNVDILEGYMA